MSPLLGRYEAQIYSIVRIVVGFLFLLHGTQKLLGFPPLPPSMASAPPPAGFMMTLIVVGAVIELVAGIMIMVGFFSSIAAFISSGEMAVAYFMFHQPQAALPTTNMGDSAVLFCFIFLYIAARGSGAWSVDSVMARNRAPVADV